MIPVVYALGAVAFTASLPRVANRLALSRAKHRSLRGHAQMSRFVAGLMPHYEYDEARFFGSDGAPAEIAERRRAGFMRLAELYRERFAETVTHDPPGRRRALGSAVHRHYRVPFQFSRLVREHLSAGSFVRSSAGVKVTDLDGNEFYDLTGAYGVNVFGHDFYKGCLERGAEVARPLGPVLGPYHPVVADNVKRLREISGLDEVSFHMSGTEAVMQAVRLARYHTRRANWCASAAPTTAGGATCSRAWATPRRRATPTRSRTWTIDALARAATPARHRLRAGQSAAGACTPTPTRPATRRCSTAAAAPASTAPPTPSGWRSCGRSARERGIVLIFDEVFVGFRLAPRGAQEYFGVGPIW